MLLGESDIEGILYIVDIDEVVVCRVETKEEREKVWRVCLMDGK